VIGACEHGVLVLRVRDLPTERRGPELGVSPCVGTVQGEHFQRGNGHGVSSPQQNYCQSDCNTGAEGDCKNATLAAPGIGGGRKRSADARVLTAYAGSFATSASEETVQPVAAFRDSDKRGCVFMSLSACRFCGRLQRPANLTARECN
jgi:hypothetical protein